VKLSNEQRVTSTESQRAFFLSSLLIALCSLLSLPAQADFLPAGLAPAGGLWTAGVPGGIPNRTNICATLGVAGQSSSFTQNVTIDQINSAILSAPCANGGVVFLNAGTYNLSSAVNTNGANTNGIDIQVSNLTLRGAGADKTILVFNNISNSDMIFIGKTEMGTGSPAPLTVANWTANYAQGAMQIMLDTPPPASEIGGIMCLDQLADGTNVAVSGLNGTPTWDTRGGSNRMLQQCVTITAINGNNVMISPGIYSPYWNASQSPQAWWWGKAKTVFNSSVENLTIQPINSGCWDLGFSGTYGSWVRGVNFNGSGCGGSGAVLMVRYSKNTEIRDSFLHDSGYVGILNGQHAVSDTLIENNIVLRPGGAAIALEAGSGDVVGYNFFFGPETSPYVPAGSWLPESLMTHGAHPHMNLIEGNEFPDMYFDNVFGSSSHNTVFRNRLKGYNDNPQNTADTGAVYITSLQTIDNIIGNVFGWNQIAGWPATSGQVCANSADDGSCGPIANGSTILWNNFNVVSGQTNANLLPSGVSALPSSMPASLYRASKPSWFGTTPWPPTGPDITGGNANGAGHSYDIPAKQCFNNLNLGTNPAAFNADTCYGAAAASAATHWVSPTGSAAWGSCTGAAPLSGSSACSLGTANSSAIAGDLVYLRGGTYDLGGGFTVGIQPTNSGSSASSMITFEAYTGETPTITDGQNGFWLSGNSYISIKGLTFDGNFSRQWGTIDNGGHHNEIANNLFTSTTGGKTISITGASNQKWATHNWIHNNHFMVSGTGCTDGGADTLDIGISQGSYGNLADNDNNNSVEDNFFEHAQHTNWDNYGMFSVFRNNIVHNEPWSSGCTGGQNPATYSSSNPNYTAYNGKYGHRNFQITEDYNRTGTYVLVEGNRSGYAGVNQSNDGADGFSLAAPQNVVRYNFFYAAMNPGLLFKYYWSAGLNGGGHGGTYNRVYNNTFYNNGLGYPWAHSCGLSTCPWPQSNISLYTGASGEGNVLKNNLMYLSASYTYWASDVMDKGAPSNGWSEVTGGVSSNWCTGAQTSNGGCSASGDPKFTNPDLSNPASTTLPDLSLQAGSGAIDQGTNLTVATNAGSGSTILTVADAMYFQDGSWGSDLGRASTGLGGTMQADWIAIGTVTNVVQIKSIAYGTYNNPAGTITLASPVTWTNGAKIWLYKKSDGAVVLNGAAPDLGASEASAQAASISCDLPTLQAAVNSAARGATITCSAGSWTWPSAVTITKGITLQGAGAGNTTIVNGGGDGTTLQLSPDSTAIANDETIKVTGFTFDGNGSGFALIGINGAPDTGTKPFKNLIITANTFQNTGSVQGAGNAGIYVKGGQVRGVIYNNTFDRCDMPFRVFGADSTTEWTNTAYNAFSYGSADNLYFEDNTIKYSAAYASSDSNPGWIESGQGGRLVVRFNNWDMTNVTGQQEFWDIHGFQNFFGTTNGQTGSMLVEYYNNALTNAVNTVYRWIDHRGSWGMFFNNTYSGGSNPDIEANQYNGGCTNQIVPAPTNYNPLINNTYVFKNTVNGIVKPMSSGSVNSCGVTENVNWWNYNANFDGTVGVGYGLLSAKPATCTTGVGYWATDQGSWNQSGKGGQGVFYKCTATNTWTLYYRPYTYPHPLRGGAPSDTTPPSVPINLTATAASFSQVNLTWTASTDNVGVTGYQIFRNGSQIGTTSSNNYADTGLSPSTLYTYTVAAFDAAGNTSAPSTPASATTPAAPPGTIIFVQGTAQDCGAAAATCTVNWPGANKAGNLLILALRVGGGGGAVTVTDTLGNTYPLAATQANTADGSTAYLYYVQNALPGSNSAQVTLGGTATLIRMALLEYSGIAASNALDKVSTAQGGTGNTTIQTGTLGTSSGDELVFAMGTSGSNNNTFTAGTGYTLRETTNKLGAEDQVLSVAGSASPTFAIAQADDYAGIAAAFKSSAQTTSACDVNGDGQSNVLDVQAEVNSVLGVVACAPIYDLNKDNQCNIIDVQRVVNAALGGQCVSP